MKDKAYSLERKARNTRRRAKAASSTRRYDAMMLNIEAEHQSQKAARERAESVADSHCDHGDHYFADSELDDLVYTNVSVKELL